MVFLPRFFSVNLPSYSEELCHLGAVDCWGSGGALAETAFGKRIRVRINPTPGILRAVFFSPENANLTQNSADLLSVTRSGKCD